MEIGRFGSGTSVDQHGGSLDAVSLDTDALDPLAKSCKHLATDLPAIKLGSGISGDGPMESCANGVDVLTVHTDMMPANVKGCNYGAMGRIVTRY